MNKSARDIIRENMRPLLSKEENELIEMMEQYAAQQVKAIEDDRQKEWAWSEKLATLKDNEQARAVSAEKERDQLREELKDVTKRFHSSLGTSAILREQRNEFEDQLAEVTRQRDEAVKLLGGNEREYYKDFCRQLENEKKDGE